MRRMFGVGITYLPSLQQDLFDTLDEYDFVEITPDGFLDDRATDRMAFVSSLSCRTPLCAHSLDMSFASTAPLDQSYVDQLLPILESAEIEYYSDHMSYTASEVGSSELYVPPYYSERALDNLVSKYKAVKSAFGLPVYFENVANFTWIGANTTQMTEGRFFQRFCDMTDSGVVLNLDSLLLSAHFLKTDPVDLLEEYPKDRVMHTVLVPTSCMNIMLQRFFGAGLDEKMLSLLESVLRRTSATGVVVARRYPTNSFSSLAGVLRAVRSQLRRCGKEARAQ